MDWFSKLFEIDRLPFKVVLLLVVVSGFLLFAPPSWLITFELIEFKDAFGTFIGITFVSSSGLAITNVVIYIFSIANRIRKRARWRSKIEIKLNALDSSEQAVLREFFIQDKYTIDLPANDSTVVGLRNKGLIYIAGQHGEIALSGMMFPFSLHDEVRDRLTNRILGLPEGEPTESERQHILRSRPGFAKRSELRDWTKAFRL